MSEEKELIQYVAKCIFCNDVFWIGTKPGITRCDCQKAYIENGLTSNEHLILGGGAEYVGMQKNVL